jgi:hypothetical protein
VRRRLDFSRLSTTGTLADLDLHPLTSDVNQFSIITELIGTPPDDVIKTICSENVRHVCPVRDALLLRRLTRSLHDSASDAPFCPVAAKARAYSALKEVP